MFLRKILISFSILSLSHANGHAAFQDQSQVTSQSTFLATSQALSDSERRSLRYHLQNLTNQFELLMSNQKVDEADLAKQGRTVAALKIYERIPFSPKLAELKKELLESAKEASIQIHQFQPRTQPRKSPNHSLAPMPKTYSVQDGFFRPKPSQFVQERPFLLLVSGSSKEVEAWIRSWKENLMRLVELERLETVSAKNNSSRTQYRIRAHAFQFKKVDFPKIIPPRARDYLPQWAQANPDKFSQKEPTLWDFVVRSEKLRPLTPPLYQTRGRFLMEGARIDFFLSKAGP